MIRNPSPSQNSRPDHPFQSVRVLGVGRAGAEMISMLQGGGHPGLSFGVIDADATAIAALDMEDKLFVGARLTRGFGAGGDPDLARAAADEEAASIRALCAQETLIFVMAGLGGGSGTGIAPVVARVAREAGASVFAFVTLPFECEGSRRQQQALIGLHRLKTVADGVLCLPNEMLLPLTNDNTTLVEAFRASREHIRDAALCIWGLLTRPGLMRVNFADICSVLRGPNLESAFARVECEGPERAVMAVKALMEHPLLEHGDTLRRAESLLVHFSAGQALGMGEIRSVMDELQRYSGGARVVVGTEEDGSAGERLTVSVITSSRQIVLHEASADPGARTATAPSTAPTTGAGNKSDPDRSSRRLIPPPPELTPDLANRLLAERQRGSRGRKKPEQVPLPLEIITKGRFEKCEPTVRRGHNLDQPTYLRRGVTLN